ncbi:MAG TPA: fructosamine kinase family protein [Nocardioidaceae bacterium]|jgi:fructosamine-3-kinase
MSTIAARAEALLGTAVVATTPVAGGDVCTATRLRLSDGRSAFVKTRPHAPTGFFAAEARGLDWLADGDGAAVPKVLGVSDDCLILSWIEPGRPSLDTAEAFARQLAATHTSGADRFGGEQDGYIGTLPLTNAPADTWTTFWATRRVLPYLKVARDRDHITDGDAAAVEEVIEQIDEYAGPPEPPSRIHGDLWSGNIVWAAEGPAYLVDPAAHGGHRETDLAMLALFGAPHLSRLLEAYDEAAVLADGWRERQPLHQLHPLLVHAILFGGSYGSRAGAAARSLLDGTSGHLPG